MKAIELDINFENIETWADFHHKMSDFFGFPDYYGNNLDALLDCLSSLRIPEDEMTNVNISQNEYILLRVHNVHALSAEIAYKFFLVIQGVNQRGYHYGEKDTIRIVFC